MTIVLLTGFEPFGGDATNPSGEAVHLVAARWSGPQVLITDVLPVSFDGAQRRLRELIAQHEPEIVIGVGLAAGRRAIGVERVAVNLIDARIPDNDGAQPIDTPCVAAAPAAHFSTLPVKAIVRGMVDAGIRAEVSYSAGTFVCNHTFFVARDCAAPGVRVGFVHVPWASDPGPGPDAATLPMLDIVRAIEIAVRTTLETDDDIRIAGGTIH